ncbi:MAG: SDR family oxidoreductase, partial [Proteobacteria bacterium]|nr:SDR family oxidoreductase [Pseudomonadota bacterium]
ELVNYAVKRFGRLDVAVNNAGTEGNNLPIVENTIEDYHLAFDTNVLGVFLCMKYEVKAMLPQKNGCILNVSSVAGSKGFAYSSIYCASKYAVEGFTKAVALEVASSNIRVNSIAPGPIDTDMVTRLTGTEEIKNAFINSIPLKRLGHPDEVAKTIVFLASDKAPFITGQTIGIDGGVIAT